MGNVEHGGAQLVLQVLEFDPHIHAQSRIEIGQRLVHQKGLRPPDDRSA